MESSRDEAMALSRVREPEAAREEGAQHEHTFPLYTGAGAASMWWGARAPRGSL